ncbi:hypothetical protein PDE_03407 [Penicillium oxalicum 114-2]|uniref:Transmembrane protein n=1 Tax=Penicillium oxalicum (strain 114-2 / CGMCC 5302) TaxID=933388 RepID=S7ZIE5_PENO1|nr:hypothetical protein PDE_03407 [Penicillium oxalicum 114-2]
MDWKFGQRDRQVEFEWGLEGFLCGIAAPADDCYGGISTASATWCLLDLFVLLVVALKLGYVLPT